MQNAFQKSDFKVTKLTTFRSPDGGGLNATLTYKGKRVADLHDSGTGGGVTAHYLDREFDQQVLAWLKAETPEGGVLGWEEPFLNDLIEIALKEKDDKKFQKMSLTKTLFRLKDDGDSIAWRTLNVAGEKGRAWVRERYGDKATFYGDK